MISISYISLAAVVLTFSGIQQAAASDPFVTQEAYPGRNTTDRYFDVSYSAPCESGKGNCEIEETWFVEWSYTVMTHSYSRENGQKPQRGAMGRPMDAFGRTIENFQPTHTCELRSEFVLNEVIGLIPEGSAESGAVSVQADNVHALVVPGESMRIAHACGNSAAEATYVSARTRQARNEFVSIITTVNRVQSVTDYILTQRPGAQIVENLDP